MSIAWIALGTAIMPKDHLGDEYTPTREHQRKKNFSMIVEGRYTSGNTHTLKWRKDFSPPQGILMARYAEGRYPGWQYALEKRHPSWALSPYWEAWFSDSRAQTTHRLACGSFVQVRRACIDHHFFNG